MHDSKSQAIIDARIEKLTEQQHTALSTIEDKVVEIVEVALSEVAELGFTKSEAAYFVSSLCCNSIEGVTAGGGEYIEAEAVAALEAFKNRPAVATRQS
jgi:hypothetical protein